MKKNAHSISTKDSKRMNKKKAMREKCVQEERAKKAQI